MADTGTTIGVFFGSRSPEHDVSIITASLVIENLRKMGYAVVPVYISKGGEWYLGPKSKDPDDETLASVSYFKNNLEKKLSKQSTWRFDLDAKKGLRFVHSKLFGETVRKIDLAFPAFHGPHGEDGTAQGLFEMFNVPYVGCGVNASVLSMDKALTKLLYRQFDIPTTEFLYFTKREWDRFQDKILEDIESLSYPLFVKPARAGSSIGISKVTLADDVSDPIEAALHYDNKIVIEEAVENLKDLTVAVRGDENPELSEIQESTFVGSDFFTYDEKYLKEGGAQLGEATKQIEVPADIPSSIEEDIRDLSLKIYSYFQCSGTARIDFLFDTKSREVYANEINAMPGTLYHHLWKKSGVSLESLLETLIEVAHKQHQNQKGQIYTFESDILEKADGAKMSGKLDEDPDNQESNNSA